MTRSPSARGILRAVDAGRTDASRDDAPLVERARAGDRAAWDRLVREHLPRVWPVVYRIVRSREDAEDVAQETFLAAFRSLAEFRGDAAFSTWLHKIAVSRALNHLDRAAERLRRASRPLEAPTAGDPTGDPDPAVERAAASSAPPSPFRALEAREMLRRLADCFRKLPPAWRAVVALRDAESRSYEDIAASLGIELGTVRSRLARARLALRDCVEGGR